MKGRHLGARTCRLFSNSGCKPSVKGNTPTSILRFTEFATRLYPLSAKVSPSYSVAIQPRWRSLAFTSGCSQDSRSRCNGMNGFVLTRIGRAVQALSLHLHGIQSRRRRTCSHSYCLMEALLVSGSSDRQTPRRMHLNVLQV